MFRRHLFLILHDVANVGDIHRIRSQCLIGFFRTSVVEITFPYVVCVCRFPSVIERCGVFMAQQFHGGGGGGGGVLKRYIVDIVSTYLVILPQSFHLTGALSVFEMGDKKLTTVYGAIEILCKLYNGPLKSEVDFMLEEDKVGGAYYVISQAHVDIAVLTKKFLFLPTSRLMNTVKGGSKIKLCSLYEGKPVTVKTANMYGELIQLLPWWKMDQIFDNFPEYHSHLVENMPREIMMSLENPKAATRASSGNSKATECGTYMHEIYGKEAMRVCASLFGEDDDFDMVIPGRVVHPTINFCGVTPDGMLVRDESVFVNEVIDSVKDGKLDSLPAETLARGCPRMLMELKTIHETAKRQKCSVTVTDLDLITLVDLATSDDTKKSKRLALALFTKKLLNADWMSEISDTCHTKDADIEYEPTCISRVCRSYKGANKLSSCFKKSTRMMYVNDYVKMCEGGLSVTYDVWPHVAPVATRPYVCEKLMGQKKEETKGCLKRKYAAVNPKHAKKTPFDTSSAFVTRSNTPDTCISFDSLVCPGKACLVVYDKSDDCHIVARWDWDSSPLMMPLFSPDFVQVLNQKVAWRHFSHDPRKMSSSFCIGLKHEESLETRLGMLFAYDVGFTQVAEDNFEQNMVDEIQYAIEHV